MSKNKKIKLVHADDHFLFRSGLRTALQDGNDVELIGEGGNRQELLELPETVFPDLVILNITMPVLDGIETLPKIKSKYPYLKVIVLSMHTDRRVIAKMMMLGANSYLTKSTSVEIIHRAIKCVSEYNYYSGEAIRMAYMDLYQVS
jgi:DNA-binding NarL/FixJ family response regulator